MILAFFLKTLADLVYYMCFAALIGSLFGLKELLLAPAFLLSLGADLSMAINLRIENSLLRFVPLAVLIPFLIIRRDLVSIVVLIPAILYCIFIVYKCYFRPHYGYTVDSFTQMRRLLSLTFLPLILLGALPFVEKYSAPYIIIYLLSMLMLLRMLRHSEETMREPKFLLINGISIALLCILSGILFSDKVLSFFSKAFSVLYRLILTPLAFVLTYLLMALFWLLQKFSLSIEMPEEINPPITVEEGLSELYEPIVNNPSNTIKYVLFAVLAALVFILFIFIFKKLTVAKQREAKGAADEQRVFISSVNPKKKALSRFNAKTPSEQVRYWYLKFILLSIKRGAPLNHQMDTSQIEFYSSEVMKKNSEAANHLRLLYLPSRYKESADATDAKDAKALYHKLKKD